MQLDAQVHQHSQLFSKLLYDTIFTIRNLLRVNHLGVQGRDKWMTIPDMSYPIASRYNVVFVSLSKRLNISSFPLASKEKNAISSFPLARKERNTMRTSTWRVVGTEGHIEILQNI